MEVIRWIRRRLKSLFFIQLFYFWVSEEENDMYLPMEKAE